ncbi:MAG: hypothetical protein ACI4O7_14485 [Aristaeellaceae bacterium]
MRRYERFSECLKRILEEEHLSASEVSRMVGFRSRNSLFRILSDQSSIRAQEEFLETLKNQLGHQWPERHWKDLQEAMAITRIGLPDYLASEAIRQLILPQPPNQKEIVIHMDDELGRSVTRSLREQLQLFLSMGTLRITMCNCCDPALCRILAEELAPAGREGRVQLIHYINMGDEVVIQNVMAIQPLMYYSWYIARQLEPDKCSREAAALFASENMYLRVYCPSGEEQIYCMVMFEKETMLMIQMQMVRYYHARERIQQYIQQLPMLQNHFPITDSPEDYLKYTEQYRQMEYDRDIYSIKPDVPINLIHPDILLPSVMDGFRDSCFTDKEHLMPLVQGLYDIHLMRFENFFRKRKVTHIVFSLEAMRAFMRTGKQTDHFFAMRPYTLAERLAILNHLRDQASKNPHFNIHFLKEDTPAPIMEITMYEGYGVMFTKANTDYNLAGKHTEALVSHPGFMRKYREFFMRELLPRYVMSHHETMAALDELARMAAREA